jgi:CRP/FNR family transcriptional regulator
MMTARTELTADSFPFIRRVSEGARRELGALSPTRSHPRRHLLRPGDDAGGGYLVTHGALRVYYMTADGREATLYTVAPGGTCVLAAASAFADEPFPAWVQAGAKGATFVRVPSAAFRRLYNAEEGFREFIFGALAGRLFELMQALEEAGCARVEQRVARYLLREVGADGTVHVSQIGIASELGTAREVVFRALRSLVRRGLLRTQRRRIAIVDAVGLRDVALQGSRPGSRSAQPSSSPRAAPR